MSDDAVLNALIAAAMGGGGGSSGVSGWGGYGNPFSPTVPKTGAKSSKSPYAALAEQFGFDPDQMDALGESGMQDIISAMITSKLFPDTSSGGGGGGSSSYSIGLDPSEQYASESAFARDQVIASLVGDMISKEYQRKGLQSQQGAALLQQITDSLGMAAPSNLKSVPGFEENGSVDRMERRLGGDPSANSTIQAFRNPERKTIPFQQIADILNSIKPPEEMLDQYKPLAEQLIRDIMPVQNMTTSESGSWSGGDGGMDMSFLDEFAGGESTGGAGASQAAKVLGGLFGNGSRPAKGSTGSSSTPSKTGGGQPLVGPPRNATPSGYRRPTKPFTSGSQTELGGAVKGTYADLSKVTSAYINDAIDQDRVFQLYRGVSRQDQNKYMTDLYKAAGKLKSSKNKGHYNRLASLIQRLNGNK